MWPHFKEFIFPLFTYLFLFRINVINDILKSVIKNWKILQNNKFLELNN